MTVLRALDVRLRSLELFVFLEIAVSPGFTIVLFVHTRLHTYLHTYILHTLDPCAGRQQAHYTQGALDALWRQFRERHGNTGICEGF